MTMQARNVLQRAVVPGLVEPWPRRVVMQTGPSPARSLAAEREIELQTAPCNCVDLVAGRATSLANDLIPRLDHQKQVPGCTVPRG